MHPMTSERPKLFLQFVLVILGIAMAVAGWYRFIW
jgi:hypothetical protein